MIFFVTVIVKGQKRLRAKRRERMVCCLKLESTRACRLATYMSLVKSLLCFRCVLKLVTRLCEYLLQHMLAHCIGNKRMLEKVLEIGMKRIKANSKRVHFYSP